MPSLRWSAKAVADISRLRTLIAVANPDSARRMASAIRSGVRVLEDHPKIGRKIHGLPASVRSWWIPFGGSGYLVTYELRAEVVLIVDVRHGREDGAP